MHQRNNRLLNNIGDAIIKEDVNHKIQELFGHNYYYRLKDIEIDYFKNIHLQLLKSNMVNNTDVCFIEK